MKSHLMRMLSHNDGKSWLIYGLNLSSMSNKTSSAIQEQAESIKLLFSFPGISIYAVIDPDHSRTNQGDATGT